MCMDSKQRLWFSYAVKERNKAVGNGEGMLFPKITHPNDELEVKALRTGGINIVVEEIVEGIEAQTNVLFLDAMIDTAFGTLWELHKMWHEYHPESQYQQANRDVRASKVSAEWLLEYTDHIEKELKNKTINYDLIGSHYHYIIHVSLLLAEWLVGDRLFDACMEVCRSNFTKLPYEKDSNGKVRKGDWFVAPSLGQFIHNSTS